MITVHIIKQTSICTGLLDLGMVIYYHRIRKHIPRGSSSLKWIKMKSVLSFHFPFHLFSKLNYQLNVEITRRPFFVLWLECCFANWPCDFGADKSVLLGGLFTNVCFDV